MNINKIINRMKKELYIRIWHDAGAGQWIGGESAVYWCGELPRLNERYIGIIGNISDENMQKSYTVELADSIEIDVSEATDDDYELEPYRMTIDGLEAYKGMTETILIDRAVLKPIEGKQLRMFERQGKGRSYIIVMSGMFVAAVILNWGILGEERYQSFGAILALEQAQRIMRKGGEEE